MPEREEIEKLLMQVGARRKEAEAQMRGAADDLVRQASGIIGPEAVDPDVVRAAADTYAGSLERLRELERFAEELRGLLI